MAKHGIMDATGHSTVEFDKTNTVDLDAAMKRFAALTGASTDDEQKINVTIIGACGGSHPSFEEWQKCEPCRQDLAQRLTEGVVWSRMYFCHGHASFSASAMLTATCEAMLRRRLAEDAVSGRDPEAAEKLAAGILKGLI